MSDETPNNDTTENTPADAGDTPDTSPGNDEGNDTPEQQFTQDDIDRIAARTRKEARDSERKKLLEDLGLEDVDSLKSLVEEARKRKEQEMSEAEKLQAELEKERQKREAEREKREALERTIRENARRQAFIQAAQKGGGENVDDLYILVQAKASDDLEACFDEDGAPDDKKLQSFIKQVQSDHPAYFGSAGAGSPSNQGGTAPTSRTPKEDVLKAIKRKHGRL